MVAFRQPEIREKTIVVRAGDFTGVMREGDSSAGIPPHVHVFGRADQLVGTLYIEASGPAISLYDENGRVRAKLSLAAGGGPLLVGFDNEGRIVITVDPEGELNPRPILS